MKIPMDRTRWLALGATIAVVAVGGVVFGLASGGDDQAAGPATTTTAPRSTTTEAPTTTSSTLRPVIDDGALRRGSHGAAVEVVQQRLHELHFDPGPVDGGYGLATAYAVEAFQALNGMRADGVVGPQVQAALANPAPVVPLVSAGGATRVEVDLRRQVLVLYQGGEVRLISHVSTGSGRSYCVEGDCNNKAVTPIGSFRFAWRYSGWRESRLGKLYNPVYFTGSGVAVHGALSVPLYPASHGCVRIPMHIAEYFPGLVRRGDPIYVTDGRHVGPPAATPTGPPPVDPPTTPGDDTPATTPAPTTTTTTTVPTTSTTSTTTAPSSTTLVP